MVAQGWWYVTGTFEATAGPEVRESIDTLVPESAARGLGYAIVIARRYQCSQ